MVQTDIQFKAYTEKTRKLLGELSQEEIIESNQKDFLAIFLKLWGKISQVPFSSQKNNILFRNTLAVCVKGWNAAILHKSEKEAYKTLADELGKDSLDYMVATNMCNQKLAMFIFDLLVVKSTKIKYDREKPIVEFVFDSSVLKEFLVENK